LDKAGRLSRGEFLSGFYLKDSTEFENWQIDMQKKLHHEQVYALQRLSEIHEIWNQ
jgi:hypothetical protein